MSSENRARLFLLITIVLLVAFSAQSKPRKMQRVATGSWGAPHIRIEVSNHAATIAYDCANGTIEGPLTFDSKGRFTWRGTHNREHPGPIRVDEVSNSRPAIYTGTVKGDTMTVHLETTVTASDDTLKHATVDFIMNPGQDLKSDSDDVCYAIHIATEKKFGLEREAKFDFISDKGIPHGQEPVSGSFSGSATYANGQHAGMIGSFSPTGFSAAYTGPEGKSVKVEYSLTGALVSTP